MIYYILIFLSTAILAWGFSGKSKPPKLLFFAFSMTIALFVGLSDMLGGYDRYIYAEVFQDLHTSVINRDFFNKEFMFFFGKEPLYGLINNVIAYFTPNRYVFILIYTLFVYIVYSFNFYKYTKNPFFAFLIFEGLMFFFTFTYLRQILAAGIIWTGISYAAKKNFKKYLIFVLLATLTHNSAAYMILLYFIPKRKFNKASIISFMLILLLIGLSGVTKYVFSLSGDAINNARISGYASEAEFGFRIEYVIESFLFLFIFLKDYHKINTDSYSLTLANTYLMFCGTLLFFCKSSDGGRIAWYGVIGIIAILENLCNIRNGIKLRAFITIMSFVLFYRILSSWGILLYPYKTFLTPGVREGDFIEERYEYDHAYDQNKLYNL